MPNDRKDQAVAQFRAWVLTHQSPDYRVTCLDNEEQVIVFETDYCRGEIAFYPDNIIQLSVTNTQNEENIFYLHFQLQTQEHAQELFAEMLEVVTGMTTKPKVRVLLSCTGGMTTGFFAEKLNEAAELLGLDYTFAAVPYARLYRTGNEYDAIFLAPQISYRLKSIQDALPHAAVSTIPAKVFAAYDVRAFLAEVEEVLTKKEQPIAPAMPTPIVYHKEDCHARILAIVLQREWMDRIHFAVRMYDRHNEVLYSTDIIKQRISLEDICDICDTAFAHTADVDAVCLALPGVVDNGRVTLKRSNLLNTDVNGYLRKKYNKRFYVLNDANCVALGYYVSQEKYRTLSLLYQPVIGGVGGMGSIFQGQVIRGTHNVAGETQYMSVLGGQGRSAEWETPEGARELAGHILSNVVSILDPEAVLIHSKLLCDTDALRRELLKYIPEAYLPDFVYLCDARDYMLLGALTACARHLKKENVV